MATYLMLLNWTDQGIRNVKESLRRLDAKKKLAKDFGGDVSFPVKETLPKENFWLSCEPGNWSGASRPTCHGAALRCTPASTPH